MAYQNINGSETTTSVENTTILKATGSENNTIELPDSSYIKDAKIIHDGADLVLDGPNGTISIEGYFSGAESPTLTAPDGLTLSPELVNSFAQSPTQYAQNATLNDVSPVGAIDEMSGEATITRTDGSIEPANLGTPIYQGDVIETAAEGAINISFIDDTSFAVSQEARLAIDEYVFDPATESGTQNFSVLKGVFVFTSGLIGRDDPDDVNIDMPSGSIGIRGTIIAGNVDEGEITVIEGAIVVRDFSGSEVTLATQYETAKLHTDGNPIENLGNLAANDVATRFSSVSNVAPTLFSSINDSAAESEAQTPSAEPVETTPTQEADAPDANGSIDQNNDSQVDGSLEQQPDAPLETQGETSAESTTDEAQGDTQGDAQGDSGNQAAKPAAAMKNMMGTDAMGSESAKMDGQNTQANTTTNQAESTSGTTTAATLGEASNESLMADIKADMKADAPRDTITETLAPPSSGPAPFHVTRGINTNPNENRFDTIRKTFGILPDNELSGVNYFTMGEGQQLSYNFSREFTDPDGREDITSYTLSQSTMDAFDANGNIGYTMNNSTGTLTIATNSVLSAPDVFDIQIQATDSDGNTSGFYSYGFVAHNSTTEITGDIVSSSGQVHSDSNNSADNFLFNFSSNNTVLTGNGNDTITLANGSSDNYINLGRGFGSATIFSDAGDNNTIITSNLNDTVNIHNVNNNVFTMGGDDHITISFDSGDNKTALETLSDTGIRINGGTDSWSPDSGSVGDRLTLQSSSPLDLDFTQINDNFIRNIERLDLSQTQGTITLGREDVIQMTKTQNTLHIDGYNNDIIDLNEEFYLHSENTGSLGNYDQYHTNGSDVVILIDNNVNVQGVI